MVFLISFISSLVAASLIFPDLLVHHRHSFVWAHDPEAPMQNIFALINQWTHGGVSLFDHFDQFNFVYTQLTSGMYTVVNIILAGVYILISPFLSLPAEGFHHIYSFGFQALNVLLRTVGGYLLLKRLGVRPWAMVVALVMLNTVLTIPMYFGLLTNNLYSYLLLLVYFIWAFFDGFRLRDLLGAALVLTVAIANSPEYAVGYFYMVVHFFIISCLVLSCIEGSWRKFPSVIKSIQHGKNEVFVALGVAFLIMLPWVWMAVLLSKDFFIAGSGMDGTHGRLANIFSPMQYFVPMDQYVMPLSKYIPSSIDFTQSRWEDMWVFTGTGVFVLSGVALVFSANRAKWVFAAAIILVILSNAPIDPKSPLSLAHWINALTNPFHFLLRSFHMPVLMMPVLFTPLIGLGLEVIARWPRQHLRRLALCVVACILLMDGYGAYTYAKGYQQRQKMVQARIRPALAGFRPIILDYQNPLHLPFREYFRAMPVPADPPINSPQNLYGLFYKYSPLERYFMESNIYNPLPKAYKGFYEDKDEKGHNFTEYYLNQDTRLMFVADKAIEADQLPWQALLGLHLERRVALVEGLDLSMPSVLKGIQEYVPTPVAVPAMRSRIITFDLSKARARTQEGFTQFSLPLPADFPMYMATGLFTKDEENLQLSMGGQSFLPVQGKIVHPGEFDVNNIHQGYLHVSLPQGMDPAAKVALLRVQQSGEILDVWRNEHDNIGVTFRAAQNGWLVIHLPYDPRWRLTIDGKKVEIFRTNKYFIGTPISAGEHKVLIEYWPGCMLRVLIGVSITLTMLVLFVVIGFAMRQEHKRDR